MVLRFCCLFESFGVEGLGFRVGGGRGGALRNLLQDVASRFRVSMASELSGCKRRVRFWGLEGSSREAYKGFQNCGVETRS